MKKYSIYQQCQINFVLVYVDLRKTVLILVFRMNLFSINFALGNLQMIIEYDSVMNNNCIVLFLAFSYHNYIL